jgi:molecular chaperone DnaK
MKEEDKKNLEEKLEELKKVKDSDQYDDMKKKMEELNEIAQKIGTAMYQNQANQTNSANQTNPSEEQKPEDKKEDEVVEGEVEEKK